MNISAVTRIYREVSQPQKPKPAPLAENEAPHIVLSQADVDAILQHKRIATPGELQFIIDHPKEVTLATWQKNEIALQFTIAMAQKARESHGIKHDPNAEFLYSLGLAETPYGLLHDGAAFEQLFKASTESICACRRHTPPRCSCWRDTRDVLWNIGFTHGEKLPEAFAARRIWEALEELETVSRPEREPGLT
jgi:hypothetical protein